MDKEPIKHAPGVVCLVRYRTPLTDDTAFVRRARAMNEGRVVTIVEPAPLSVRLDDGRYVISTARINGKTAWLVRASSPLGLSTINLGGVESFRHTHQRIFYQKDLLPIAGPGIDVDETTNIETAVPTQSPVPETT
jgi:hypothetical protein